MPRRSGAHDPWLLLEERKDGRLMDFMTSQDPWPKMQTVGKAFLSVIHKGLGFIFPVTGTVLAHGRPIHVKVSLALTAMWHGRIEDHRASEWTKYMSKAIHAIPNGGTSPCSLKGSPPTLYDAFHRILTMPVCPLDTPLISIFCEMPSFWLGCSVRPDWGTNRRL